MGNIQNNPYFCADKKGFQNLKNMENIRSEQNSIGAKVSAFAIDAKLGEPVFDKLDADIAHALIVLMP